MKTKLDNETLVGVDVPPVTEHGSVVLMVHHLTLAAAYFEAGPVKLDAALELIAEMFLDDRADAPTAFIRALYEYYETLNEHTDEPVELVTE